MMFTCKDTGFECFPHIDQDVVSSRSLLSFGTIVTIWEHPKFHDRMLAVDVFKKLILISTRLLHISSLRFSEMEGRRWSSLKNLNHLIRKQRNRILLLRLCNSDNNFKTSTW